jgi:uncharacterized protein (DUF1501 family)
MPTRRAILSQLILGTAPLIEEAGKHTLVCVFLRGGADTLNLVVPYADDAYHKARPSIGLKSPLAGSIEASRAIKLDDHYALHPALAPLKQRFVEGRLAIVQGVGTDNVSGSHFECQDQVEQGRSMMAPPAGGGWLGRYLQTRANQNTGPLSAVAIGKALPESLRSAPAVSVIQSLEDIGLQTSSGKAEAAAQALASLYGADVTLLGSHGRETLQLLDRVRALQSGSRTAASGIEYPKDDFGKGLREVARLIKARVGLEVACLDLGGWDTHFIQGAAEGFLSQRAKVLADGLAAFDQDLAAHRQNFTVIVMTEFGRRIYENSSLGTDHGRAFATMILSQKIKGGRILGRWPCVVEEGLTVQGTPGGPGGLQQEYDFRSVFSEVLRGSMGVADTRQVFPDFTAEKVGLLT